MNDSAAQAEGMITITVVDQPSFMEYAGDYVYGGLTVLVLAWFLWRKWSMRNR